MTERGPDPSPADHPVSPVALDDRDPASHRATDDELARAWRLVELQREVGRESDREALALIDALERRVEAQRAEIQRLRHSLRIVRRLVPIRAARSARQAAQRLARRLRRPAGDRPWGTRRPRRAGSAEAASAVTRGLRAQAAAAPPTTGPLVSIVMLNRDGAFLLRRCLPALATTAYRDVELVFVDNASSDDSLEVLAGHALPFPVRVIRNETNLSFSDAHNAAFSACRGELVLLLNNDIEPVEPGWLGTLVETALATGADAAGARLVYPAAALGSGTWQSPPLTLQHAGVAFRLVEGGYLPVPVGVGLDPLTVDAAGIRPAVALTAACLLVRRAALDRVGGFSTGYEYGLEDVDLCLKLRASGGELIYDGRASLWHHESATRGAESRQVRVARVAANRERFTGTWGPSLFRTVLLDALAGGGWLADGLRVHLPSAAPAGVGDPVRAAIATLGWEVAAEAGAADLQVLSDPGVPASALVPGGVRIAWLAGDTASWEGADWLPDVDVVLAPPWIDAATVERRLGRLPVISAPEDLASAIPQAVAAWLAMPHLAIHLEVEDVERARLGGDLHFARDLQRAMQRLGRPTRVRLRGEWEGIAGAREDATLLLNGRSSVRVRPGQVNMVWQISHPEHVTGEQYRDIDLAFAVSEPLARLLRAQTGLDVHLLLQAADGDRFHPGAQGPHHELLFVANSRRTGRHIITDLLPTDHELAVYGQRWDRDGLEPRYLGGTHIPNDLLPGYYASADIVLNDHWAAMRREAMLSNRLFDASAAGAFVISDEVETLEEVFDGGVVAYRDADDLRRLVDHYLAAPDERRAHAERARAAVLARHTFAHRAASILAALEPLETGRPSEVVPAARAPMATSPRADA